MGFGCAVVVLLVVAAVDKSGVSPPSPLLLSTIIVHVKVTAAVGELYYTQLAIEPMMIYKKRRILFLITHHTSGH